MGRIEEGFKLDGSQIAKNTVGVLYQTLAMVVGASTVIVTIVWLTSVFEDEGASPFVLAQFSGMLGGFVLIGAFVEGTRGNPEIGKQLIRVAKLSIVAAVGFAGLGMLIPAEAAINEVENNRWFWTFIFGVSLYGAIFPFSAAIGLLLWVLSKLRPDSSNRS